MYEARGGDQLRHRGPLVGPDLECQQRHREARPHHGDQTPDHVEPVGPREQRRRGLIQRDLRRQRSAISDIGQVCQNGIDGDPLVDEIASVFNGMADQLDEFTAEVTRVAREVGTEGKLGGQAHVPGVSGTWKDLTDSVNAMAGNLTTQVRKIAQGATAVAKVTDGARWASPARVVNESRAAMCEQLIES